MINNPVYGLHLQHPIVHRMIYKIIVVSYIGNDVHSGNNRGHRIAQVEVV